MKNIGKYLVYPCILLAFSACTDLEEKLKGDITDDINIPGISTGGGGGGSDVLNAAFSDRKSVV